MHGRSATPLHPESRFPDPKNIIYFKSICRGTTAIQKVWSQPDSPKFPVVLGLLWLYLGCGRLEQGQRLGEGLLCQPAAEVSQGRVAVLHRRPQCCHAAAARFGALSYILEGRHNLEERDPNRIINIPIYLYYIYKQFVSS